MIYLDYAASTPCDDKVIESMLPFFNEHYANPSNINNRMGSDASSAVQQARNRVASHLRCQPKEIIWTSGATESNNIAILGTMGYYNGQYPKQKPHVITSSIEHNSVLNVVNHLQNIECEVSYIAPNSDGSISTGQILEQVKQNTIFISIMMANNELGVINDLSELAKITSKRGIILHTDATQALGKIPINLKELPVDLLSFSGHKIYAAKGIGGLFIRDEEKIDPIIFGGGQERGLRSGTSNVPGIVGLAKALDICIERQSEENLSIGLLRNMLEEQLTSWNNGIKINGLKANRLPHISNISFPIKDGYNIMDILTKQKLIACSSGSACDTDENKPSHVMMAFGKTRHEAKNTLRFSLGRFTTEQEISKAVEQIIEAIAGVVIK